MFRFSQAISRSSLGAKVMSLLGTALLSSLIIFALSVFYFVYRAEGAAWRGRQSEAARAAAGTISNFLQRVKDSLIIVSIVEPTQHVDDSEELYSLIKENSALLEIVRTDGSGKVISSASRDGYVLANLITIPQSQWFLQGNAGQEYIGNVQLSAKNEPYIVMAVPSSGGGVVAARVEMNVLWEVVDNIHFGKSGQAYLITRTGQIIAHTNPDIVTRITTIQDRPEFTAIMSASNHEWFGMFTNFEGKRVVSNTRTIEGTHWIVVTELPVSEAFSSTRNAIYVLGSGAFFLMIVVSLIVAQYVRLLIVKPMNRLKTGVEIFGKGQLTYRIGLDRNDEIGQFANAFDTMAAQIQDREEQLAEKSKAMFVSEARYRAIVEDQTDLVCRFRTDGTLTFVNEAYCRYFGKRREALIGHSFMPLILDEDRILVGTHFSSLSPENPVATYEHRVILSDGSVRWQQWTDRAIFSIDAEVVEYASVGQDITERKLAQIALLEREATLRRLNAELEKRVEERTTKLRESEERYMLAVRGANDGLWDWDLKTNQIYFSPRWKSMLGYREQEIGSEPDEWFTRIHGDDSKKFQETLNAHVLGSATHFEIESRMLDKNNTTLWMLCRGIIIRDVDGNAYRMTGSLTDITDRKRVEERLAHDALHDALTNLPNRVLFIDRLQQRLEHTKRHKNDVFAILFIDLDRFKVINDSLGHAIGDTYLVTTAQRLQSCLRPEDTICRLGGDEFAILLNDIRDVSDAIRVAERMQTRLKGTTLLGPVLRSSTASIGITVFNGNYSDPQEMLRDADSAMYRAKAQGGGRYQVFDLDMYKSAMQLLHMETNLKRAVENEEWQVLYQPVVHSQTRKVMGVEALVRWLDPERGIILPAEFIPFAEEAGLITQIGDYVLREACCQVKKWRQSGNSTFWVSVNLSARQFQDQLLVSKVQKILQDTGLPGDSLHLEVTETVAMKDLEYSVKILKELDQLGIHLSLDDFGNGYSSLGYLKRFPIQSLKIDRSFIRDIDRDKNSEAITSAIISLGHNLHLQVIAEGVETQEQYAFLKSQLCDELQGYLFGKPAPANEISKMIWRHQFFFLDVANKLQG